VRRLALALLLACAACESEAEYLTAPVPIAAHQGALLSRITVNGGTPLTTLLDTGSPLTVFDDGTGSVAGITADVDLYSLAGAVRARLDGIRVFTTPLGAVGEAGMPSPIQAVLGGDQLGRFVLGVRYGAAPHLLLQSRLNTCGCDLADSCWAVFPFQLLGGAGEATPPRQVIAIGGELYAYPATRVLLDVCLEPYADPLSADIGCAEDLPGAEPRRYAPSGVPVKAIVATGFPGVAISSSAWDRLRGPGAAAQVIASQGVRLRLPDPRNDTGGAGLQVGTGSLGADPAAALAVVSSEAVLGPCSELARSRRQRRALPKELRPMLGLSDESRCLRPVSDQIDCRGLPCADEDPRVVSASILELGGPMPVYVVPDTAPLLVGIREDVPPTAANVELILGAEALQRMAVTIDYPGRRVLLRCDGGAGCLTYPRFVTGGECNRTCTPRDCVQNPNDPRCPAHFLSGGRCALP
jgi:hypothetical protein